MRLAVMITMALSLVAGAAFAKTPYHDGTAEVIKPTDKNHPLGEIVSGYDFRKAMIRDVQDDDFENPAYILLDTPWACQQLFSAQAGQNLVQKSH